MDDDRPLDSTAQLLRKFVGQVSGQVVVPEFAPRPRVGRRRRRAPGPRRVLAVVLATAAVVGAVALVIAYGPRSSRPGPGHVPATQPAPGTTVPTPTSTPKTSVAAGACAASQLTATVAFNQSGAELGAIRLTNTGAQQCTLSGQPKVQALDGRGAALDLSESTYHRAPDWPPPSSPIVLSPSGALPQAIVELDWTWCSASPGRVSFAIRFSGWPSPLDVANTAVSPPGFSPASCTDSGGQPLFAVDSVRGFGSNGIIGPTPASTQSTTAMITYAPFTATGAIDPGLQVTSRATGTCIRYSRGPTGRDYYRCFGSGSGIYDPCFAGPQTTAAPLVCPMGPISSDITEFTVTSITSTEPPSTSVTPWAMQLSGGQVCLLVSAAWGGLGPYGCQPSPTGSSPTQPAVADCHAPAASPAASQPLWSAACQEQEVAASPFTTQDVATLWF